MRMKPVALKPKIQRRPLFTEWIQMRKIASAFVGILSIMFVFANCSRQPSTNNPTNAASSPQIVDFPICGPDTRNRIMIVTGLTTPRTAKVNTPFEVTVSAKNTGGCHARQASTSINLNGAAGGQMIITYTNLDKGAEENQDAIS
jgi:hypothetical protein